MLLASMYLVLPVMSGERVRLSLCHLVWCWSSACHRHNIDFFSIAPYFQLHRIARRKLRNKTHAPVVIARPAIIDAGDNVSGLNASQLSRAVALNVGNQEALWWVEAQALSHLLAQWSGFHSQPAPDDTAILNNIFQNLDGCIGRDSKADAD